MFTAALFRMLKLFSNRIAKYIVCIYRVKNYIAVEISDLELHELQGICTNYKELQRISGIYWKSLSNKKETVNKKKEDMNPARRKGRDSLR